jgi:hypothetical protein
MTRYILSAIRGKWIPPKPDEAIAGINYNDYLAMQLEERMWWEDRNQKLFELGQISAISIPLPTYDFKLPNTLIDWWLVGRA